MFALLWCYMIIRFLGTGAAEGVPAMFCNCDVCKRIKELGESEFRSRTQVIVDGTICIDFPPEAYSNSLKFGVNLSALKYLLVTHSHMDHFYAHDFILRGYKYATVEAPQLEIYGNEEIKKVFCECTAREMKPQVTPNIVIKTVHGFEEFVVGGYRVLTVPANHDKNEEALLYYVEKDGMGYLHFYDTGEVKDEIFEFLALSGARVELVSFDCTFAHVPGGENARHMGIANNMAMKQKLLNFGLANDNTKYVITHFSHNSNPIRERLKKLEEEYGVIAAYDGLEVEL